MDEVAEAMGETCTHCQGIITNFGQQRCADGSTSSNLTRTAQVFRPLDLLVMHNPLREERTMAYNPRLYRLAEKKGWKLPAMNNPFGSEPWNRYWAALEEYEKDPSSGRPVPPHRSA